MRDPWVLSRSNARPFGAQPLSAQPPVRGTISFDRSIRGSQPLSRSIHSDTRRPLDPNAPQRTRFQRTCLRITDRKQFHDIYHILPDRSIPLHFVTIYRQNPC